VFFVGRFLALIERLATCIGCVGGAHGVFFAERLLALIERLAICIGCAVRSNYV
jgi:hypothetical protein